MKVVTAETSRSSDDLVLIVVPCLNEERYIEGVVTKLVSDSGTINFKIVVTDGGSTDRTRKIVQRLTHLDPRIMLMDNPRRVQAAGINEAVVKYGEGARFLLRMDAHANYPEQYCEKLLNVQERTQADSVVVSMNTVGFSCFQRAAAAAQNSILGNGGSAHRNKSIDRWVDHGHHALMTIDAFMAIGGYDETFSHNEDAELDNRLHENGFRLYLTSEVRVTYYPRNSLSGLFRQYFNIGHGRARNFLKHRRNAKSRHFVLAVVAPALCALLLLPLNRLFALPTLIWISACVGYGFVIAVRLRDICAAAAGLAAIAMHSGWSFGFYYGISAALLQNGRSANGEIKRALKIQKNIDL